MGCYISNQQQRSTYINSMSYRTGVFVQPHFGQQHQLPPAYPNIYSTDGPNVFETALDQRQDDIVPNYSVVSNPNYSSMNHEQVINSNCTHAPAPNIIYPAMSYEQRMQLLSTMRQQRREFIAKRLKENLPAQPITVASLFVIALSIALFTLQIVMLTANDRRANAGSGWWGGVVGCIFGIIHLVLVSSRKYYLYVVSNIISIVTILSFMLVCYFNAASSYIFDESGTDDSLAIVMIVLAGIGLATVLLFTIAKNCVIFNYRNSAASPSSIVR